MLRIRVDFLVDGVMRIKLNEINSMITAIIDVADGLSIGAAGKLTLVELGDQNRVLRVWILFPNGVGVKAQGKVTGYANSKQSVEKW
ncbi:hypothetical protein TNIN_31261 [Trichonephila inaurata madagascariensis]|uniref:Uncharacterized protein n=1 Tax=Trichonephila inaurata madagascariensis TaxID=2747483 RepID=A0A8X6XU55_9ARAC|nr:hypothetical protein TNIN_31261 [Trichonephila inaurata madagascariensis]